MVSSEETKLVILPTLAHLTMIENLPSYILEKKMSLLASSSRHLLLTFAASVVSLAAPTFTIAQDKPTPKASRPAGDKPTIPNEKEGDWKSLFNGKDIGDWIQKNGWAQYRIDGNAILGTTSEGSPNSFLCTKTEYSNFELRFQVKVDDALNSGVQIRSKSIPEQDHGRVHGPQVEIEASPGEAGFVYGEGTPRGWISPDQPSHSQIKNGDWNQYHIRAQGNRITTWINGKLIEDITDEDFTEQKFGKGFIGLQVHGIGAGQGPFQVRWKEIFIRELK